MRDSNQDGQPDGAPIQSTTTDVNGNYQFADLEVGHYLVAEVDPANYESILDNDVDVDVPADGTEIANTNPRDNLLPVSLIVDLSNTRVEDDSGNNFVDSPILAGLGDTVWYDHNANGIQEAGEAGIANVTVNLQDENGTVIDTMVTGSTGFYQFTDLLAGDYTVVVDPSTFGSALQQTYDLDDGVSANPVTINAATVTLAAGDSNNEVDFGYRPLGSLGDTVWNDSNANGILDAGETGIAGVTVTLTGAVSATTTTDANGEYTFTGLPIGTYTVSVSGSALDDFEPTHDLDDPMTTTPITANTADVELVLTSSGDAVESRDDVDFGYYQQLSSITGTVLEDSTGDNAGDRALRDNNGDPVTVMLTLYKADASGNPVGQSLAMTTANTTTGVYRFTDLPPGDYVVIQSQPSGYNSIADHDASADGDSFDSDTTVDDRIAVTIKSGESEDDGNNFVEQRLASISGWVAVDTNASGHGDTALPGVQLTLLDSNGNAVGTTTSSTGGGYSFNGLLPGDYTVVETQPAGYSSVKDEDADTTGYGDPDSQDADKAVDDKVGSNLKPGESDISNNFVERALLPAIDIRKQAEGDDVRDFKPGDTVEFEIQVTNTGSIDLSNVVVTDPQLPACDRVIGFLGFGQSTTYTCSMVLGGGESVSKTWLDNFSPAYSYSGNDGNTNFLGNWVEHDPQAGGASSGRVMVGSNYKLWMNNYGYPGGSNYQPYAERGADLSGLTTATLSFDWITHAGVDSSDAVALHVKPEGGSWTQLDKFWGANTSGKSESYDITPYISSNTKFRFTVSNYYGGADETFKLDNFKIVAASASEPAQGFINVANVSGEAMGITVTDSDPSEVVVEAPAVCEVCTYGQSQVTLKVSNWASNRDQNETIRVREGGLGGALLYEGRVSNGGSFTFDVFNPGTTIVVTVQGYYHPSEYVKGYFVTDCNLNVNYTNGNSYITFKVTNVVGDGEGEEACPGGPVVPPVTSGVTTTITNAYAGLCLDTLGVDTGSSVYKRSCSGATNQKWELKPQGNYFEITNADSKLCLDVNGSSSSVNGEVGQWSCHQGSNQLWDIQTYGSNYLIKSKSSGMCLEIQGSGNAYQYTCDGYIGQQWSLTKP